MSDSPFYCKGDRVIILPGPFSNNLSYGFVGTLSHDIEPEERPEGRYYSVVLESAPADWVGKVVQVHRSQLCIVGEAMRTVLAAREAGSLEERVSALEEQAQREVAR